MVKGTGWKLCSEGRRGGDFLFYVSPVVFPVEALLHILQWKPKLANIQFYHLRKYILIAEQLYATGYDR